MRHYHVPTEPIVRRSPGARTPDEVGRLRPMQEHTTEGESPHDSTEECRTPATHVEVRAPVHETDVDVSAIGDLVKLSLRSDAVNQIVHLGEEDARSLVNEVEAALGGLE